MVKIKTISILMILLAGSALFGGCTSDMPYAENRVNLQIEYNDNLGKVEVEGEQVNPGEKLIYENGTELTLEAIPDEGSEFEQWSTIEETDKKITIVMDDDLSLIAEFSASAELTVNVEHELEIQEMESYLERLREDTRAEELYVELLKDETAVHTYSINVDEEFKDSYSTGITVKEIGTYSIVVELRGSFFENETAARMQNEGQRTFYKGREDDVEIRPDVMESVEIQARPSTADSLTIQMTSPDDALENLFELKLEHASSLTERQAAQEYVGDADYGEVIFEDGEIYNEEEFEMMPGNWDLGLVFHDTRVEIEELILLPCEEKKIELEIYREYGDIVVNIIIAESPSAPTNLRVEEKETEKYLRWDWDGEGAAEFTILRTETDDLTEVDYLEPVTEESIEEMMYPIQDLEAGYYYWVRAYDEDGYSSYLSTSWKYGEGSR